MKRLVVLGMPLLAACAPIASLPPTHVDVPISMRTVERAREGVVGEARQEGTVLHLTASQACDVLEEHTVSRTTTVRHENRAKWLDASLGIVAVAAIGTGTWIMLDSSKVHEDDKTSRTYNPTGPTKAFAYGVATTTGGVALLSIPIVDVFRARRVDTKASEVKLDGEVQQASRACSNKPAANGSVRLRIGGNIVAVGTTNDEGKAHVDLLAALHSDLAPELLVGQVPVAVEASEVGSFDLRPIYEEREERAWRAVDVASCRAPTRPSSCQAVSAFARTWTQGNHFEEARALLASSGPELARLHDERLWDSADVKTCAATSDAVDAIEQACKNIEQGYLKTLPEGLHASEARDLVEKGLTHVSTVRERLQKQAAREAERAERRDRRKAAKDCEATCLMGCSGWRARDEGMCLVACLRLRCGVE